MMKQILFFLACLFIFISIACNKKIPDQTSQYTSISGFVCDSLWVRNNNPMQDSMLADFNNDGIADLSICGYNEIIGASALYQASFYRLNALNSNYEILSEIQNDTLCNDTTMLGNQVMCSHIYNWSSPNGVFVTGTYAVSSLQYLTLPAGIFHNGMLTIYNSSSQSSMMGYPAFTHIKQFGNSIDGYFFIKQVITNEIYALKLRYLYPGYYIMEAIISL